MKKSLFPAVLVLVLLLSACGVGGGSKKTGAASKTDVIIKSEGKASADDTSAEGSGAKADDSFGSENDKGLEEDTSKPVKLTAKEAYDKMNGTDPVVVVDVRTAKEYAESHIPGAILIPNEEIGSEPPKLLPVLSADILIYCRSGNRSAQAAEKLAAMGYTKISDFGGIRDWPYDTESGEFEVPSKTGELTSFSAYDLNGVMVDESAFSGHRLTMVNVWATFCGYCLREMPYLGELAEEYSKQGVQVIGIVSDVGKNADGVFSSEMIELSKELAERTGAEYRHFLPSEDLNAAVLSRISGVPVTFFVDSSGNLVGGVYLGARDKAKWSNILDSILKEAKL